MRSTIQEINSLDNGALPPESNNLMTGATYLESLNDGREIWFDGERVKNVNEHPAFRNAARSMARLYDALHDPALQDDLTTVDKFGHRTHRFFAPAYSTEDLFKARKALDIWQRINYGWMGRSPDYKAAFMAQLAEGYNFYAPYNESALNWYKKFASQGLHLNHVLIDPPVNRAKGRAEVKNIYLSLDRSDDKGIYVTGAKMVATGSALTHATFVGINSGTAARMEVGRDEDMALIFIVDMNAPGLKLISRPSYELNANSPFDAPLASRFDENDAVVVFEGCFVPWENVLIYRDVEKAKQFYAQSGFFNRFNLQAAVRLAIKLEFCIGLMVKGTEASGTDQFRGVQAAIGELVAMRETISALSIAMISNPEPGIGQSVVPRLQTASALRIYMTNAWTQVRNTFETVLAGAPSFAISSVRDMDAPELEHIIDTYYQGTNLDGRSRIKLFNLVWDALYSEFAGRHGLYERNYAGNKEQPRLDMLRWATMRGEIGDFKGLVDSCMADYDTSGWVNEVWQA
ncbi:MAG: 4-hydroxyphenylacetate 3-hydroxylase N-terminal domain-containing protein [Chloroflexota bacterium]